MSAFANIKTYVASGADSFLVQAGIAAAELQVFFSTKEQERLLVLGTDYAIEANGHGLQIHLLKPLNGFITLARVPDPCVTLQKFGIGMLPELNAWAERVASRLAYVESRLALADARPIGTPCIKEQRADEVALYAHALRFPFEVDELQPPPNDCMVLGWRDGKPYWTSPESIAARVYVARQEPVDTITLYDLKTRGLFFGRQPKPQDFTREVEIDSGTPDIISAIAVNSDWCDLIASPALCDDPFELWPQIALPIVAAIPPALPGGPCKYRVQVPISLTEGNCL